MLTSFLAISGPWLWLPFITSAGAVLVNVTVDDSLPDPLTGRLITYLPTTSWKSGVLCTDCSATVDGGNMFDRTWHDGTYFPANSNLPPTGPLNATFSFSGTAIYVFCAISLSISSPTGFSNMTFYIDNELVGQFERVPPGLQGDYQYNVSVYSNTSLPAGEHTFMLQNGQFGNGGNKSLTLFDYLVYSYDNGQPTTFNSSSVQTPTSSSTGSSFSSRKSLPAGAIAGGVVGGIAGIAILGLLLWFLRRRRSRIVVKMNEKYSSVSPEPPADSRTMPQPFTARNESRLMGYGGGSSAPASSSSGHPSSAHVSTTIGYGVGTGENASHRHRYMPSVPSSVTPSSSIYTRASYSTPSAVRSTRQREMDAGPIVLEDEEEEEEEEEALPPEYGQVFMHSSSRAAPESSSTSVIPIRKS
ncbi:hypothetical protein BDQ17DRAFT_1334877 [Cyathus striatus]|nr:hypothetical protein BDQ17DRAFT_1334877 [Cyathus striatus]